MQDTWPWSRLKVPPLASHSYWEGEAATVLDGARARADKPNRVSRATNRKNLDMDRSPSFGHMRDGQVAIGNGSTSVWHGRERLRCAGKIAKTPGWCAPSTA